MHRSSFGVLALVLPTLASAHQKQAASSLVFDKVTVVDVEQGTLVPDRRVVVVGNRIRAVGTDSQVRVPVGARRIDARGKYLIPGLWDLHVHPGAGLMRFGDGMIAPDRLTTDVFYPLFIANGITGIRDAWSNVPLETLRGWRREIVAGTRVGPPRQILSGAAIDEYPAEVAKARECYRHPLTSHVCILPGDTADARRLVTELRTAGADMIKMYNLSAEMYAFIAAEARRQGLPVGGHATAVTPLAASDFGASIVDHDADGSAYGDCGRLLPNTPEAESRARASADSGHLGTTFAQCMTTVAARLQKNGTWLLPTILYYNGSGGEGGTRAQPIVRRFSDVAAAFWAGSLPQGNWLRAPTATGATGVAPSYDTLDGIFLLHRFGLPLVAGTDAVSRTVGLMPPGFALHAELASEAANGVSPLEALRAATLNPAKLLHRTDSLGSVAAGKLADLVLLDANPLDDITNTTAIRAVVANGRYFDRAALDRLMTTVRAKLVPIPLAAAGKGRRVVLPLAAIHVDSEIQGDPRYAQYLEAPDSVVHGWADSMIGAALVARDPRGSWTLPKAVRSLVREGKVADPDAYREGWEWPSASLFRISDTTRTELRRLAAAAGGSTIFVPVYLRFRQGVAPGAGVCVHLAAQMVEGPTGEYLWRSFLPGHDAGEAVIVGCGATPPAALAAALDAALPRVRRSP